MFDENFSVGNILGESESIWDVEGEKAAESEDIGEGENAAESTNEAETSKGEPTPKPVEDTEMTIL